MTKLIKKIVYVLIMHWLSINAEKACKHNIGGQPTKLKYLFIISFKKKYLGKFYIKLIKKTLKERNN